MITVKNISEMIKKRGLTILLLAVVFIFLFSPDAKSWLLQQLISTGLFNAKIKKEGSVKASQLQGVSFSLIDSKSHIVNTSDWEGKIIFINFWASWCPPCRAEMPSLNALYNQLKNDNQFVFLFVNEDQDSTTSSRYLQSNHFNIPLYKLIQEVPESIYSGTLPTTIVIDKNGHIVWRHEGMADYNTSDFMEQLKHL